MNFNLFSSSTKPFENKTILQILVVLLVLLAIVAGYYYTAYDLEQKKNNRLERQLELLEDS